MTAIVITAAIIQWVAIFILSMSGHWLISAAIGVTLLALVICYSVG